MTTRDDILERLALAETHPWGPTRSALTAEAVTWADALEDEQLAVDTRLALAAAYNHGNEEWKALAPFAWLLTRYESHPDLFDADRLRKMNWNYKWAVPVAADNPAVPDERLRELVEGMEEFYRAQGASMHAVHADRHHAARMLGLDDEAEAELAAWRSTPRDNTSDCKGCDPMRQVVWASLHEDWETAVATAVPVLNGDVGCSIQPQSMQGVALLPLLASGRPRAAWDAHVRSYRILRSAPQVVSYMAYHLEYLALSGRPERGLKILRECGSRTDEAESARVLLSFVIGAALVLRESVRAGRGQELLGVDIPAESVWCLGPGLSVSSTLAEAEPLMAGWARAIAARYDRRNGNTTISERVERRLTREPITTSQEVGGRDALAHTGVELIEAGEELPEPLAVSAPGEEEAQGEDFLEGIEVATFLLGPQDGDADGSEDDGAAGHDGVAGDVSAAAGTSLDDEPYPVIDISAPLAPADDAEMLARFAQARRRPGSCLEREVVIATAIRRGFGADSGALDQAGAPVAHELIFEAAARGINEEETSRAFSAWFALLDGRPALTRLRAEVAGLSARIDARGALSPSARAELGDSGAELAGRVTELATALLQAPAGQEEELAEAFNAAYALVRCLSDVGQTEAAGRMLDLAGTIAPHLEHLVDPSDGALALQLRAREAYMILGAGDPYGACALAEEILRACDPCPFVVAVQARYALLRASLEVHETEEAMIQSRELLNAFLAAGLAPLAGPLFAALSEALQALGRPLEAAEVLEAALGSPMPVSLTEGLRLSLIPILDQLDEEPAVRDASLEVAEAALGQGRNGRAVEYFVRAAAACENLYENSRAAQLFERAAALVDASDNPGKVYRARVLRRAARAVVDEPTPPMSRARLDEARELMARARELLEMVPDTRQYSAAYEMGDWHDDMAWILYRVDEYREALEHCALASEGYMTTRDLSNAARPLALAVAIHMEEGEPLQARESIAAVRQLLSHRRWSNHPALARVAQLEEQLDLGEQD